MSSNFFSDALRAAMATKHFNQAQLAEFLTVDPAYISRWLKGSSPRLDQMRSVLTQLGWKIERARPDYDPFADAIERAKADTGGKVTEKGVKYSTMDDVKKLLEGAQQVHKKSSYAPVPVIGRLNADAAAAKTDDKKNPDTHEILAPLFPCPTYTGEELFILTVEGDALAPAYPAGSLLFVRPVQNISDIPEGAIVFFASGEKGPNLHIRRLFRIEETKVKRVDRLIGAPLTPAQEYMYFKPREANIPYALVGCVNPSTK